jgi:hypothetical protein
MNGRSRHVRVNLEYCVDAKQKDHLRTQPGIQRTYAWKPINSNTYLSPLYMFSKHEGAVDVRCKMRDKIVAVQGLAFSIYTPLSLFLPIT